MGAGRPAGGEARRRIGGRYELKELVGRGAMAQVYRADDTLRGREVALKIVRHEIVENPTAAARFQREVKAASKLLHPGIVRVYEWGIDNGHAFIAMELVKGEDLFETIGKTGPLPQELAVRITIEICKALAMAHRKGVIHRDLKPENIMVLPGSPPRIKVLDFGIAKLRPALADDSWNDETAPRSITKTGTAVGTPSHMAPEQARGATVDGRTDLYGVGILMYEMLTGRLPFEGKNPVEIAIKHVREIPLPPQHHRPDLHPRLNGLIVKALAKSPSMRPTSADAMRATLETLLEEFERDEDGEDDEELPMPTRVGVHPEVEEALAAHEGGRVGPEASPEETQEEVEAPTRERATAGDRLRRASGSIDEADIPTQKESTSRVHRRMRGRGADEEPVTLERASRLAPHLDDLIEDEPTVTFLEPLPDDFKEESTRVIHAPPDLPGLNDPDTVDTVTKERPSAGPELPVSSSRISFTGVTRVSTEKRPSFGPGGTLIREPDDDAAEQRSEREKLIAEAVATVGDPLLDDVDEDAEDEAATEIAAPSPAVQAAIDAHRAKQSLPVSRPVPLKTLASTGWPGPAPEPPPPTKPTVLTPRPAAAKTLQSAGVAEFDPRVGPPPSSRPPASNVPASISGGSPAYVSSGSHPPFASSGANTPAPVPPPPPPPPGDWAQTPAPGRAGPAVQGGAMGHPIGPGGLTQPRGTPPTALGSGTPQGGMGGFGAGTPPPAPPSEPSWSDPRVPPAYGAPPSQEAWVPYDPRSTGGQLPAARQDLEQLLRQMPEPERHTAALIAVGIMLLVAIAALIWALTL